MDFGATIKAIKNGHCVKREDWEGFWYLPKDEPQVNGQPMNKTIVAVLKDEGGYAPASPYMADMLTDDWIDLDENDENDEKPKPKMLEEKKEDFYHFLQLLNHALNINDISGIHHQYTVKIKDKYVRLDFGTHFYHLTDTDEYDYFGNSSLLSSNEVIESLKDIFESSNYSFDSDDVTIYSAIKVE